ncbi:hypothetical protein [Streptomyces griseiscabiei]|uniref:Secreted protein n=1 Tax=Streptomyces griseiscabiei TaxID=2993540 RepID=A0ABU4LHQ2_9ACTN|nr:hypothetical protein [Streptomyces griseiscabiei]MBZ3908162.1 hypothetical protein [Streptomyces griseiscabiei]MDX2915321.1 hypothetical protein [Streptomyces griseiscabiei]
MPANRPRRRRTAALGTGLAALVLSAGLLTGCEFGDSLDCVSNADTIAESLRDIHRAGLEAANDPARTGESVDTIEKNLDEISGRAADDDSEVDKAVDDLTTAVRDYNRSVLNGDTDPDTSRIDTAADELTDVCTP